MRVPKNIPQELLPQLLRILKASAKLTEEQGRIARRNARSRTRAEIRRFLSALDNSFPNMPGPRSAYRAARDAVERRAKLEAAGWVRLYRGIEQMAVARIPMRSFSSPNGSILYVPIWARTIWEYTARVSVLTRCKKDLKYRKALLVEAELARNAKTA